MVLDGSNSEKGRFENWTMPNRASSSREGAEQVGDTSLYESMGQLNLSDREGDGSKSMAEPKIAGDLNGNVAISVLDRVLLRRRQLRETAAGKHQATASNRLKMHQDDSPIGNGHGQVAGISAGEDSSSSSLSNKQTAYGRATEELRRLRTQVTDYQVQLKLQSDFIRQLMGSDGLDSGEMSRQPEIEDLNSDSESMQLLESMLSEISEWVDNSFGDLVAKVAQDQYKEFDKSDDIREKLVIARSNFSDSLEKYEIGSRKLAAAEKTVKDMEGRLEEDVSVLKDQGVKISGLESSVSKYKVIQADLVKLRQSYEQLQLKLLKAEKERRKLQKEREVEELKSEVSDGQNGLLEEQLEKINQQQEQISSLKLELQEKQSKIDELNAKVESATKEMLHLQTQVQLSKKQAGSLRQGPPKSLQTRNRFRQVASLPGSPLMRMHNETKDESQSELAAHINFQTHALRVLSRLLDRRSIREAAGKVLQLANRNRLQLPEASVRQLRFAVDEYLLAGIDTVVQSRLELAQEPSIDASEKEKEKEEAKNKNPAPADTPEEQPAISTPADDRPSSTAPVSKTMQLRLDELTRRWKAAEEALGFERKQSQRRLDDLDMENDRLKSQIKELEDRHQLGKGKSEER